MFLAFFLLVVADLFRASFRRFRFRQPFLMLGNYGGILVPVFASQQVGVVPGIVSFAVVEFFGAILVTDVAPVAGADGMVATALGHEGGTVPPGLGVFQQGGEALAIQVRHHRQTGKIEQCRVDVDQADGRIDSRPRLGDARCHDDEGYMVGFLPEGELHHALLIPEVIAMVRPEHDDGVFRPSGGIELIEELPDLGVGVGGGRLVGTNETLSGKRDRLQPGDH